MSLKCFMIHETTRFRATLRRYGAGDHNCGTKGAYHNAEGPEIAIIEGVKDARGCWDLTEHERRLMPPKDDPRWPAKCDACDYLFQTTDPWQVFADHIYVDDAGKEYSLRKPVPGMMWYSDWGGEYMKGPDGRSLHVICPDGGEWCIDSQASNCTKRDDTGPFGKAHRCWCRHGVPPLVTVDKVGLTCAAGAGSIMSRRGYHGFLRNGEFT